MFSFNSRVSRRYRGTSGHFVVETGQGGILGSVRSARIAGLRRRLRRPRSLALRSRRGSLAFDRKKEATIPRHSMGLAIYLPTLTPQTTPTDRHIWQSHGVSGIYDLNDGELVDRLVVACHPSHLTVEGSPEDSYRSRVVVDPRRLHWRTPLVGEVAPPSPMWNVNPWKIRFLAPFFNFHTHCLAHLFISVRVGDPSLQGP